MMIYVLLGLVSAMFFGIGAVSVYGTDGLLANVWVEYVFWWLIGSGALLSLLEYTSTIKERLRRLLPPAEGLRRVALSS